jgi:prevent-host-death family protein
MTREVGAYEAKTKLPQLLRDVAQGEHVTITVHGRPVAELAPVRRPEAGREEAVSAMRRFRRIKGVEARSIAERIREGRR